SGKISAVRRTFLLLTVFDVGLTFILWVIYTQVRSGSGWDTFKLQVKNYSFETSLFDTVMLSFVRFTLLNLAYALFRLRHWWPVAFTTLGTCVFLIVKIFEFKVKSAKNPLSYCLVIVSFVLAWVETWFMDFKVIPHEKKEIERHRLYAGVISHTDERTPLLNNQQGFGSQTPGDEYYSPLESEEGSDSEEQHHHHRDRFYSDPNSRSISRPSSSTSSLGKVIIEYNAKDLWYELVHRAPSAPDWNPTILENRILCIVDDNTDVCYSVAAEGGGGLISSRDFVTVRHYGTREGIWLSSGIAATHPDMPPQKKYIRGENAPGGWVFKSSSQNNCIFSWYVNTDLKGWLPQKLVDQALASVLLEYVVHLKKHVVKLKQSTH
ncbi:hypothetical protein LOTGIDRAFT_132177, partial [Lottia gigantea]